MNKKADLIGQVIKDNHGTIIQNIGGHQLPPNSIPSIKGFVGCEEYLKELRKSYQKGSRCFVLHGIGGVGKTSMAFQFASEITGEYEAKIRVDMQGMSKNPLSARDAMLAVVREFERDIAADIPEGQLKNLYVSKLQNQPTLIVLDNAANMEAVESLNQTEACLIVTSRQSFVLTNGKSKQIAKMSSEDARELLFINGGGEERFDGRADELAELAGYLPMALKPLAALLAEDELETAADLIERYRDKQELLKERVPDYDNLTIEASFELSYEALSDEMKERWRRLSVFSTDFDQSAIVDVLSISSDKAKALQKGLRRFSLLEVHRIEKRFNLHDLIKVFANNKLSDSERFQSQYLHAKHYNSVLQTAQKMQDKYQENYYINALNLIDLEWNNIVIAQNWTAEFIENNDEIATLCAHYAGRARDFVILRLTSQEDIIWLEAGLKAAKQLDNRSYEGDMLGNLGLAYEEIDHDRAIDYHEQALIISQELGDQSGESSSLGNLGNCYNSLKKFHKALEYHEKALKISCETNNKAEQAKDLGNIGGAYYGLEKYGEAIKYQKQSLAIKREIGDLHGEANSLGRLGFAYFGLGEKEKACAFWKEAMTIFEEIKSPNAHIFLKPLEENNC